ncbi:MAG: hypothetical protein GWP63_19315 [Haliea sp.]|nr:hypothetical protein [Haliea sp.]
MRESAATQIGGDPETVPEIISTAIEDQEDGNIVLEAPDETGAYRLFAYVYNSTGLAGHANIPFFVESSRR